MEQVTPKKKKKKEKKKQQDYLVNSDSDFIITPEKMKRRKIEMKPKENKYKKKLGVIEVEKLEKITDKERKNFFFKKQSKIKINNNKIVLEKKNL